MIIEFDGFGINEYVFGRNISIAKLKSMYLNVKNEELSYEGFIELFCIRNNYERIPQIFCKDIISDIVVDLDTDYIYLPTR